METKVELFIKKAKEIGMKKDQLMNFIGHGYIPLPWQLKFHVEARKCDEENKAVKLGVGGARGPGKSHGVFAQIALDDCQRIDGLKCLFIRQTGLAAKESFEDLIDKVIRGKIKYEYNSSRNTLIFPNNSKVLFGGFNDERDISKYIGIEYDLIAIEELNQLRKERVEKLLGSLRTSKDNWRPRFYASFNPGGAGHNDVKNLFVIPARTQTEKETKFIPATFKENPYLNKEYIDYLNNLQGNLGKAWREGDFDIFEGQFFNEWNYNIHTCEPFEIPVTWKRIRGIDHGRTAPTACLWGAVDQDGTIWFYREYYQAGVDADINAQKIARLSENEKYVYTKLDSACFSKTGAGETIAEIYERNGVWCEPSEKNRLAGWALFHEYLRWDKDIKPKMMFFKNCINTIESIPTLIHDERHPEDLDTNGNDHCVDAISYLLQSLHESKSPAPKDPIQIKLEQMQKKFQVSPQNLNRYYSRK